MKKIIEDIYKKLEIDEKEVDSYEKLSFCIAESISNNNFLWFCDEQAMTYYGGVIGVKFVNLTTKNQGEAIRGRNVIVNPCFPLNDNCIRDFFGMMEFLVFKLVHLKIENGKNDYLFGSEGDEGLSERIKKLRKARYISDKEKKIFHRLKSVRDKFAHTVNSLNHIPYKKFPLSESFTRKGSTMVSQDVEHYFDEDAYAISEALLKLFIPIQSQQLIKKSLFQP